MPKQLRKPENWQDFESLCKKLWGEIWDCPEIKKNGRSGQKQDGVDIYGTPKGESEYYGIQCKGKDDYTKAKLTTEEVDNEIEKARGFNPKLKKFFFATTANKDVAIEEYIRLKDQESRQAGGFEIHLFSWEDIVDLIDENKRTHDWYVKNIDYRSNYSVKVTFGTGETHLEFNPKLIKNHIKYERREKPKPQSSETLLQDYKLMSLYSYGKKIRQEKDSSPQPVHYYLDRHVDNPSSSVFNFLIVNDGNIPIENFKLDILFALEARIIVDVVDKKSRFIDYFPYSYNVFSTENSNNFIFEPKKQILVQNEQILTDKICLRPTIEEYQDLILDYKFIAKDFDTEGKLTIRLNTEVIEKHSTEIIDF